MNRKFVEIRTGRGDLGREMLGKDTKCPDLYEQWEVIPVDSIQRIRILLPEKRNIEIKWKVGEHEYTGTEYFKDQIDCIKRYVILKHACGIKPNHGPGWMPMDVKEFEEYMERHPNQVEDE